MNYLKQKLSRFYNRHSTLLVTTLWLHFSELHPVNKEIKDFMTLKSAENIRYNKLPYNYMPYR